MKINTYIYHIYMCRFNMKHAELEPGQKKRLEDLCELARKEDWHNLPKEDLDKMVAILEAKQKLYKQGIHSQPAAVVNNFRETCKQGKLSCLYHTNYILTSNCSWKTAHHDPKAPMQCSWFGHIQTRELNHTIQ